MRFASVAAAPLLLLLSGAVSASFLRHVGMQVGPYDDDDEDTILLGRNGTNGWGTFDQLIDHANPHLGTFKQRYWYGTQYWKGPGSPVVMVNPGEQSADNFNKTYTTTQRLAGLMAQELGGAVVVLEHRYWGQSSPFANLTVANLRYLTLDNAIRDNAYFARHFDPPFDPSGRSAPAHAPWIFTGGSYPGALAGWIAHLDPGTFWAYHGSSGVVEAVGDFWQYFVPVMDATPQNCTRDLTAVIDYVDEVLIHGSPAQKKKLKDRFLLGDLEDADFASAIENGPWSWQETQFYSESQQGYNSYYQFCDYIENVWPNSTNPVPGPEGVGQCKALEGYAKWFKDVLLPGYCESGGYDDWKGTYNTQCFANSNASNVAYKDLSLDNFANRQWNWLLCNEPFEWWQDGAPAGHPTIVSRLVNVSYWSSQCALFFPPEDSPGGVTAYGLGKGLTARDVNARTGGWSVPASSTAKRLMYTNGQYDPWRDATVSSTFRPGGPRQSTPELPVRLVEGGVHCSDFYGQNWAVNPALKALVDDEVANMKRWVDEFYEEKGKPRPH
ncbi:hypothetical protein VTK73DRAFT_9690 [Phialemonium thermophilum]|uniref:Uncharacterized protein n=1 Tax=Phialemonium thermophilum TaxID=223376 RepID=A0ABR3W0V7_9PEZI